ncbi:hypothetical protein WMY93_032168 [Mugilogobius chulae]|uniref:Uncharacterized protein n=1 Tax=Mugilogobius chulae TaxID=88201 RepID=A0AAW0MEV5_9GOBI
MSIAFGANNCVTMATTPLGVGPVSMATTPLGVGPVGMILTPFTWMFFSGEVKTSVSPPVDECVEQRAELLELRADLRAELRAEQLLELCGDFVQLVRPLKRALQEMEQSYAEIRREARNLIRLQVHIDDLQYAFAAPHAQRPLEVVQRCERVLNELEDLLTAEDLPTLIAQI